MIKRAGLRSKPYIKRKFTEGKSQSTAKVSVKARLEDRQTRPSTLFPKGILLLKRSEASVTEKRLQKFHLWCGSKRTLSCENGGRCLWDVLWGETRFTTQIRCGHGLIWRQEQREVWLDLGDKSALRMFLRQLGPAGEWDEAPRTNQSFCWLWWKASVFECISLCKTRVWHLSRVML